MYYFHTHMPCVNKFFLKKYVGPGTGEILQILSTRMVNSNH
jgi:hypothetical protein